MTEQFNGIDRHAARSSRPASARRRSAGGAAASIPANAQIARHQDRPRQPAHRPARRLRRGRHLHPRSGARHPRQGPAERRQDLPGQIISKDSQSSGSRAAEVASELILRDKVDLLVASATPDTTNPVADQAEVNEVPCITTNCPWQPYFFGRKGDPTKGFTWTYHFFWGLEDVIAAFLALWDGAPTNKVVGGLFPNDADGNAWGDPELGLPPALAAAGYKLIDPGRYQLMNNDFSSQISAFKAAGAEIVTGNMIPPDFATFWSQAAQQGFKPKIVTIGKALLFPSVINSLGARGNGLTSGNLVDAEPSVQVRPHRPERAAAHRRLHQAPPSGRGRSRSASSTRCSRSRSTCSSAPRRSSRRRSSMRSSPPTTSRSSAR